MTATKTTFDNNDIAITLAVMTPTKNLIVVRPTNRQPTTIRVLARDQSASREDWQKLARTGEIVWFYNGRDRKKTGKILRKGHFGRAVSESWLKP